MKIVRGIRKFVSNSSVSVRTLVVSIRGVSQFVSNSCISVRALVESVKALVEQTKALTDDSIALVIKAAALWAPCRQTEVSRINFIRPWATEIINKEPALGT